MLRSKINLSVLLCILLSACYPVEKVFYHGTVKGVGLCIENNIQTSELLSKDLVEKQCIKQFSKTLDYKYMDASAWVEAGNQLLLVTISDGKNLYEDVVITEITLEAVIYDEDGTKVVNSEKVEVWIEPNERLTAQASIKFDIPVNAGLSFCSDLVENKFCKSWGFGKMRGLEIDV